VRRTIAQREQFATATERDLGGANHHGLPEASGTKARRKERTGA